MRGWTYVMCGVVNSVEGRSLSPVHTMPLLLAYMVNKSLGLLIAVKRSLLANSCLLNIVQHGAIFVVQYHPPKVGSCSRLLANKCKRGWLTQADTGDLVQDASTTATSAQPTNLLWFAS